MVVPYQLDDSSDERTANPLLSVIEKWCKKIHLCEF